MDAPLFPFTNVLYSPRRLNCLQSPKTIFTLHQHRWQVQHNPIVQLPSQLSHHEQRWVAPIPNPENLFAKTKSPILELKPNPTLCTPTAIPTPNLIQNSNPYINRAAAPSPCAIRKSPNSTAPPVSLLMARPNPCIYRRCNITVRSLIKTQ